MIKLQEEFRMNPKIRSFRNQMTAKGLDGMIVSNPVNIRYLTGLTAERNTFAYS